MFWLNDVTLVLSLQMYNHQYGIVVFLQAFQLRVIQEFGLLFGHFMYHGSLVVEY